MYHKNIEVSKIIINKEMYNKNKQNRHHVKSSFRISLSCCARFQKPWIYSH